jgi:hypothetical protein
MSYRETDLRRAILSGTLVLLCLSILVPIRSSGADDKTEERYSAFGVAMGAGAAGVLEFTITRWTTPEERQALIDSMVENGQEKTVELLRAQKETGFARSRSGAGMKGWPSVRLHYAYQFEKDGKRQVVIVTERNIGMAEAMRNSRSVDYEVSGLVMELQKGDDGKEKGQGTLYMATKFGFDKDKKQLVIESLGQQPVRLTDIRRQK